MKKLTQIGSLNATLIMAGTLVALLVGGLTIAALQDDSENANTSDSSSSEDLSTLELSQLWERDFERKTDLQALSGQFEAYAAKNGYYPTLSNFGSDNWVRENLPGLDLAATLDPTTETRYQYEALPNRCTNTGENLCLDYVVSADLEEDGFGQADADNDPIDEVRTGLL